MGLAVHGGSVCATRWLKHDKMGPGGAVQGAFPQEPFCGLKLAKNQFLVVKAGRNKCRMGMLIPRHVVQLPGNGGIKRNLAYHVFPAKGL